MKYLFTPTGLQVLESLSFTKTLYAFDFDGTLSPIVNSPDLAKLSSSTAGLIRELAFLAPIAIVSGRSLSDLKKRVENIPCHLIGNHGLEGLSSHSESIDHAKNLCDFWKSQLKKDWKDLEKDSGVFVEDKVYSIALHYRRSRNKKLACLKLFEKIEKLDPAPRIILGKSVINLVPPGAPHKGVALLEAMLKLNLKCAFYIGDDDTDEDVFSLPDCKIITARVGEKRTSNAQFYIKRQTEINNLIKKIIKQVCSCKK